MIWFLIGFSFSLNVMLIALIGFVLFNPDFNKRIYEKVDKNIKVINESRDPFKEKF